MVPVVVVAAALPPARHADEPGRATVAALAAAECGHADPAGTAAADRPPLPPVPPKAPSPPLPNSARVAALAVGGTVRVDSRALRPLPMMRPPGP